MLMGQLPARFNQRPVVVVMGVSGCGKSTIASELAARFDVPFFEGDEYHPQANVDKMSNAIALTDEDRWPWLAILGEAIGKAATEKGGALASCSSLKAVYRERLAEAIGHPVVFAYLDGSRELLMERMSARENHYMPTSLLDSQLDTLEKPGANEPAITVSIDNTVEGIVNEVQTAIQPLVV